MNVRLLILVLAFSGACAPARAQQPQGPLGKDQVMDLVKYGMSGPELAAKIRKLGIDFEPTEDYVQALRKAGAKDVVIQALLSVRPMPLTRDQVGKLVAGGVPSKRAATLVKQRGIDFLADEKYLDTLELAGGDQALIAALRDASASAVAEVPIATSPHAEVFVDGESAGHASDSGEVTVKTSLGAHTLKVSLPGKIDFQQSLTLTSIHAEKIAAMLVDAPGSIRVRTVPGAGVSLDGANRGSTDSNGELMIAGLPAGPHQLRVVAPEKKDRVQPVAVTPGQETFVYVLLDDVPPTPGQVRENPKDGLKYVWIPPGTFTMGCSPGDNDCNDEEKPAHPVTLTRGFWIGQTDVTVGAYKRFTAATGRRPPRPPEFNRDWAYNRLPMVNVNWTDARDFCAWAGGRLPTEAEWEYAARGGSTQARYGTLDEIAWYEKNSGRQVHEVAQKRANGFGIYDVLGNVFEWVNDWYDENYFQHSPAQDPLGPASGQDRVVRGGAWVYDPKIVRVSFRAGINPNVRVFFGGYSGLGFRCGGDVFGP